MGDDSGSSSGGSSSGGSSGWGIFGPYHHRDGMPPQGPMYNPDGSKVAQWPWGRPPKPPKKPPKTNKTNKRHRQGRRGGRGMARSTRKPRPVRIHPAPAPSSKPTQAYPTPSTATGGAMPARELDALGEVGLTPILAELVNHGTVTLSGTLAAWQREQDRITNRAWRRPGGMVRPAGL